MSLVLRARLESSAFASMAIGAFLRYAARMLRNIILFFLAILAICSACSAPHPHRAPTPAREARNASVAIMCRHMVWEQWDMSREPTSGSLDVELVPCCSGFAVRAPVGLRILTAAHCTTQAKLGENVAYVTRHDWKHTSDAYDLARLVTRDDHDRAVLEPINPGDLHDWALELGAPVGDGAFVRSISQRDDFQFLSGQVVGSGSAEIGSYYMTTLDILPGWSGAPVLDLQGRAVGIVFSCGAKNTRRGSVCLPSSGNYVDLLGLDLR